MKRRIIGYSIDAPANKLNHIIRDEIKRKSFSKRHNLAGNYSESSGFDLYPSLSFVYTEPNAGPFVMLNLKCVNINKEGDKSKIILKRVDGATYNMHRLFSLIFSALTTIIIFYLMISKRFMDNLYLLVIPAFSLCYYFGFEVIAKYSFNGICRKVEKIMKSEKIKYVKQ